MTLEEKIAMANQVRSRDRFGPVSPEELAALPDTETELWIETANGCEIHVFEERPDARLGACVGCSLQILPGASIIK